jgi:ankyrin repeat protein
MGNRLSGTLKSDLTAQCYIQCSNKPGLKPDPDKIDTHRQLVHCVVQLLLQKLAVNALKDITMLSEVTSYTDLLFVAVIDGYNDMIQLLAKLGADLEAIDHKGRTVIYIAVERGRAYTVALLGRLGCKTRRTYGYPCRSLMHIAATRGDERTIRALNRLDPGLVDVRDVNGCTPTHYYATSTVAGENPKVIELLGQQNIATVSASGQTPLHLAAMYGKVAMIAALIEVGSTKFNVNLDQQNSFGETPMHLAVRKTYGNMHWDEYQENDRLKIVELLLIAGSNAISMKNNLGLTPMFFMYNPRNCLAIELMVRFDSSVLDQVDNRGESPMMVYIRSQIGPHTQNPGIISMVSLFGGVDEYYRLCAIYKMKPRTITEDELAEVRYRVYFSCSLVYYLLCVGQRHKS